MRHVQWRSLRQVSGAGVLRDMAEGKQRNVACFTAVYVCIDGIEQWLAASAAGLTEFEYFPSRQHRFFVLKVPRA